MQFLRNPAQSQQAAAVLPTYTGLQLNTATNALPIPLCYGMTAIAANIVYYANFTPVPVFSAQQHAGKGGGGGFLGLFGGGGASTYQVVGWYYRADVIMTLCEGPISEINQIWQGQSNWLYSSSSPNPNSWPGLANWDQSTSLFLGTHTQTPWPPLIGTQGGLGGGVGGPGYALSYSDTAYIAGAQFSLGQSASIGTLRYEVCALFYGTGANGIDADPALVVQDFLTSAAHGAGFPSAAIDTASLLAPGSGTDSSFQTYCKVLGLAISPNLAQFETASSILDRWLKILNTAAVWSGSVLKLIPHGDMSLESPSSVLWTAPITPVYALTDNDFIHHDGEDPVQVSRVDPSTLFNVCRVEVLNRAGVNVDAALVTNEIATNLALMQAIVTRGMSPGAGSYPEPQGQPQYQATPIEARDLMSVKELGGIRVASTFTAHEICDPNMGAVIAQTMLQRGLYIRNSFKFTLGPHFCLLDPMDVVTLTDFNLGMIAEVVRITEIEERDDGFLDLTAEEMPAGVSTPAPNISTGASGVSSNSAVAVDPMQAFLIWEPPPLVTGGTSQIWFGASGGASGLPDPNWGGCYVWASIDGGTTFAQVAKINGAIQQGALTSNFPLGVGFDTVNTLSVDMTLTGAVLTSTADANAQQGVANLCLIDSELVAYATATLTSVEHYNLSRVQRGLFGTTAAAHLVGATMTQMSYVTKIDLNAQFAGQTLYFKFQSFNIYGGGVENLSSLSSYSYVVSAQANTLSTLTETVTPSGASILVPSLLPANAWVLWIKVEVLTTVTGATSVNIDPQYLPSGGAGGSAGLYGNVPVAFGSSHIQSFGGVDWSVSSGVVLTAVGGSFTGGSVKVTTAFITVA